jgi:hypothetical protein
MRQVVNSSEALLDWQSRCHHPAVANSRTHAPGADGKTKLEGKPRHMEKAKPICCWNWGGVGHSNLMI